MGAKFSTLDIGIWMYAMQFHSLQKQPNLKFKSHPKQLLGYHPLAFALPVKIYSKECKMCKGKWW
jgi:hypothetical protein